MSAGIIVIYAAFMGLAYLAGAGLYHRNDRSAAPAITALPSASGQ